MVTSGYLPALCWPSSTPVRARDVVGSKGNPRRPASARACGIPAVHADARLDLLADVQSTSAGSLTQRDRSSTRVRSSPMGCSALQAVGSRDVSRRPSLAYADDAYDCRPAATAGSPRIWASRRPVVTGSCDQATVKAEAVERHATLQRRADLQRRTAPGARRSRSERPSVLIRTRAAATPLPIPPHSRINPHHNPKGNIRHAHPSPPPHCSGRRRQP